MVSDWGAIEQLQIQHVAANRTECAELAINAGLDMDMGECCYEENLEEVVKLGKVSEKQIDESVKRILFVKEKLGLFENPYVDFEKPNQNEFMELSKQAAVESAILLKNRNNILPLKKNSKILVTGPLTHLKTAAKVCWAPDTNTEMFESVFDALKIVAPDAVWSEWKLHECAQPFGGMKWAFTIKNRHLLLDRASLKFT